MRQGDVVLIDFPFSTAQGSKIRLGLVVQCDALNEKITNTIVAMISSRVSLPLHETHALIEVSSKEGKASGLRVDSVVRCENVFTIDQQRIIRVIGHLSDPIFTQVSAAIRRVFDI